LLSSLIWYGNCSLKFFYDFERLIGLLRRNNLASLTIHFPDTQPSDIPSTSIDKLLKTFTFEKKKNCLTDLKWGMMG
jgi:hypothetical protein